MPTKTVFLSALVLVGSIAAAAVVVSIVVAVEIANRHAPTAPECPRANTPASVPEGSR